MEIRFLVIVLLIIYMGCNPDTNRTEMNVLSDSNHDSLSTNTEIILTRDINFGDTEDVIFTSMGEFVVDDSGRVYIADEAWGYRALHVFDKKGRYIKKLASEGRGPAEFLSISHLQSKNGLLMFFDADLQRISLYSTQTLELVKSIVVDPSSWQSITDLQGYHPTKFYLQSDSTFILGFELPKIPSNAEKATVKYYLFNTDLNLISEKLFEHKSVKVVWSTKTRKLGAVTVRPLAYFPFFNRTLFTVSGNGNLIHTQTKQLHVHEQNLNEELLNSFEYPIKTKVVTREDAEKYSTNKDITSKVDLPNYWPAIYQMFNDNEDRIWISTHSDETDHLDWWIFNKEGDVIGRFSWPGKFTSHPFEARESKVVKDGYFYEMANADSLNQRQIVRYKIELLQK